MEIIKEIIKESVLCFWNTIGKKTLIALVVLHSIMLAIYYGFGLKGYVLGFDIQCIEIALWCGYNVHVINKWIADNRDNKEYQDMIFPCNVSKWASILIAVVICITVIPMMLIRANAGLFLMPWP